MEETEAEQKEEQKPAPAKKKCLFDDSIVGKVCIITLYIWRFFLVYLTLLRERRGGLMVSVLDSGLSGLGSSTGQGDCVVFLGKILYSHSTSLHPGV